jgi:hypothetical protein
MSLLQRKREAASDADGEGVQAEKLPKPAVGPAVPLIAAASAGSEFGTGQFSPIVGDLIEAVFAEGCWVPAVVLGLRSRQVQVEFEVPQPEPPRGLLAGAHCYCQEDDTVRDIARRFNVPPAAVLKLNLPYYEGLTTTSKLRRRTLLALPLVLAARENDTPRAIASEHGLDLASLLEANCAFIPELLPGSKLKENTLLVLPENVPAPLVKGTQSPMPHLAAELEVPELEGEGWRKAEVRQVLSGTSFGLAVEDGGDYLRVVQLSDLGTTWRWPAGSAVPTAGEAAAGGEAKRPMAVGDDIEVEVNEEQRTRWRAACVRAILPDGSFKACVDGDEEFIETYAPHEENSEWRWPLQGRPRATEWVAVSLTRPRPPVAPPGFLLLAVGGGTVQVLQDGGWWKAALADDDLLFNPVVAHGQSADSAAEVSGAPGGALAASAGGAVFVSHAAGGASAAAIPAQETVCVFLLTRNTDTYLRVTLDRVRPDWEIKDGQWRVVSPQAGRTIEASVPDGSPGAGRGGGARLKVGGFTRAEGMSPAPRSLPCLRIGEPLSTWAWATAGAHAEVCLTGDAAWGSWWIVQLLEIQLQAALVSYEAFAEKDGSHARLQEWVPWSRLRPRPPATPADFLDATRVGEAVQLWWEDAWWDATLLQGPSLLEPLSPGQGTDGAAPVPAGIGSLDHLTGVAAVTVEVERAKGIRSEPQAVPCSHVRPGWIWRRLGATSCEGEWLAPCIAPVGVVQRAHIDVSP